MRYYQITDCASNTINLLEEYPVVTADNTRQAINKYLKQNDLNYKAKVSGDNDVHFKVTPVIYENGCMYIDGSKRAYWFKIVN